MNLELQPQAPTNRLLEQQQEEEVEAIYYNSSTHINFEIWLIQFR